MVTTHHHLKCYTKVNRYTKSSLKHPLGYTACKPAMYDLCQPPTKLADSPATRPSSANTTARLGRAQPTDFTVLCSALQV